MAILRVKAGPHKGKVYEIRDDSLVIGRDVTEGIQVLDQGVSRRHAEIFRIGEMYFIRDLESRNGTFVNDKTVNEDLLRFGDQVRIGNSILVFEDKQAYLKDSNRILSEEPAAGAGGDPPPPSATIRLDTVISSRRPELALPAESEDQKHLHLLLRIATLSNEERDLSRLLGRIAVEIGLNLNADHVYILWSKDEAEGTFEILGRFDKEGVDVSAGCVSRSIIRDCMRQGRAMLTADASADRQFSTMATVVMKQLRSVLSVPILLLGTPRGVLYVYSSRSEAFKSEDLQLASAVGIELGATIGLLKLVKSSDNFFRNSIRALVSGIEMKTPETRGKSERVASFCISIAKELGLDTHGVRNAWLAGMLHDLGSIPLSDKEREQALTLETKKNHFARELLKQMPGLEEILPALECQNERWDGSGSPEGRKGEAIPILGRILGIALELDGNLYHGSAGGEEMTIKDALLKIRETADRLFDRETVNALLRAYRSGKLFDREEDFFEAPIS
ncbi:MAG TPA: HD domain-containing phosphohydrolase [Planctomycetota bacterium]|nr:HD domain-containing phosphohydrolase [Planctomycetota bacterium]